MLGLTVTSAAAQTDPTSTQAVETEGVSDVLTHKTESHLTGRGGFGPGPATGGPRGVFQYRGKLNILYAYPRRATDISAGNIGAAGGKGGIFRDGFGKGMSLQAPPYEGDTGNVTGRILDGEGNGLSGADVRLVNASSGTVTRTTNSDDNGDYSFGSVEPGRYRIEAELSGRAESGCS